MSGRKAIAITDKQLAILRILWRHGPMTVRQVLKYLPGGDRQPYTTCLGMLQTMEKAYLVNHQEEGGTYLYAPAVPQRAVLGLLLRDFVARFFSGSAEDLVVGLVDADELSADDLNHIRLRLNSKSKGAIKPTEERE